jgi:nitrogen fixation protein NifB
MDKIFDERSILASHPCFSKEAHGKFARVHLPVAPACNIQCGYCIRKFDCVNESRPGVASRILSPSDALERVRILLERNDYINVIGIAGPGDPLANEATFETLNALHREFPDITLCLSTNGLLLPDRMDDLLRCGVKTLTITINSLSRAPAEKIYSHVVYKNQFLKGRTAAECLIHNQWNGLFKAVQAGLVIKINTICMPGINDEEIPLIATHAGNIGAHTMNIMPLIPQGKFKDIERPSCGTLTKLRETCGVFVSQMTHCTQCRSDAFGLLGEDRDMELEVLNSRIGEDYCDNVL